MKYLSLILWLMLYFVNNCHSQSINEVYCQPYKSTPTDTDGSALYVAKSEDRLHSLKADGTEEILTTQDRGNRPFVPQKKD